MTENTKIEFNRKPSLNDFRKTNTNTFVPIYKKFCKYFQERRQDKSAC